MGAGTDRAGSCDGRRLAVQTDWAGVVAALLIGVVAGFASWIVMQPVFSSELLARENYRGRGLPVAGGLAIALGVVVVGALAVMVQVGGVSAVLVGAEGAALVVVLGYALLGFVDDLVGSGRERGFRGHARALARGRLTAGGLKLVGGGGLALLAVYMTGTRTLSDLLRDAVLIALAANLGNLLDLAPGRTLKVAAVCFAAVVVISGADPTLRAPAVVVGAALGLLWPDLRERVMLGDTGANPVGAVLGLAVVLVCAPVTRVLVVVVLLFLNMASELVSFSRVISRVPPLRMLDELGREK